ncbi:MAG TPA: ABC transporter permease subunit [Gemmataceae bacterium]|jgi:ABC-type transport system involved in multi-copper enzyme maturation permease subunit|nr:ABC transporter permease subunit [Gemmataceae bacterium]
MSDSPPTSRRGPPPLPKPGRKGRRPRRRWHPFARFGNALLGWEVLRAGRRTGTLAIARTALGGLLLAAMWALYASYFQDDGSDLLKGSGTEIGKTLSRFAESFALTFFLVQATAVLLLTPVFVAGAIFEERETRSGEILLTTELTRREVYVGKLGARMIQVLLVVLAGMPILFLTQLWGGVSMGVILVNYAATGIAIFGAGVVTAAVSAYAESLRGAILRSYGLLFLMDVFFFPASPYFPIVASRGHWGAGLGTFIIYLPLQLVIVLVGYFIGQRWLRMAMLRQKTRITNKPGMPPPLPGASSGHLPPIKDDTDPFLWKELNAGGRVTLKQGLTAFIPQAATLDDRLAEMGLARWLAASREIVPTALRIVAFLIALLLACLAFVEAIPSHWMARNFGALALCWLICAIGLTAATGISRERQKQTLIDLLMLPGPRRDLLRAKALASLIRGFWPAAALLVIVTVSIATFGVSLFSAALLVLTAAGMALSTAAMGVWLSARCRNALHATSTWIGVMAGIVIGTFLLAEANMELVQEPGQPGRLDYPAWTRTLNPLLAWGRLAFRYDYTAGQYVWGRGYGQWPVTFADLAPALLCPILYAGLGGLLWLMAVRRFEKEGRS